MYSPYYKCQHCGAPKRSEKQSCECAVSRLLSWTCIRCNRPMVNPGICWECWKQRRGEILDSLYEEPCLGQNLNEPTRHCSNCGIGTCEQGKSLCEYCGRPKVEAMTLERAVEILNNRRHDKYDEWVVHDDPTRCRELGRVAAIVRRTGDDTYVGCVFLWRHLNEFEAIAIAEKYEREANAN